MAAANVPAGPSGGFFRRIRRLLFRFDPERTHHTAVEMCRLAGAVPGLPERMGKHFHVQDDALQVDLAGLRFSNSVGLAAGWDKSGRALRLLDQLGFGFVEIGSVSARPSKGNPKPRLFRLPEDRAIVVNYGLPNDGAARVARRLQRFRPRVPLGVNVVNTNDGTEGRGSSVDEILDDYCHSVSTLASQAGYLALNLSCPNVAGEGNLFADRGHLVELLQRLRPMQLSCPVFLKVPPDPEPAAIESLLAATEPFDFVRGFNFNLPSGKPPSLQTPRAVWEAMPGAVSGKPVESLINTCIAETYRRMPRDRFVIIGAGGVFSAEDAYLKIRLGASLVQLYTALIYEGPSIVKRINLGLASLLKRDGFRNLQDAVGVEHQHRAKPV